MKENTFTSDTEAVLEHLDPGTQSFLSANVMPPYAKGKTVPQTTLNSP